MPAVNMAGFVVGALMTVSKIQKEHLLCMGTSALWINRGDFETHVLPNDLVSETSTFDLHSNDSLVGSWL